MATAHPTTWGQTSHVLPIPQDSSGASKATTSLVERGEELLEWPAVQRWVAAHQSTAIMVSPAQPCLVATLLAEQLSPLAGYQVCTSTSYHSATLRCKRGWNLGTVWLPPRICRLIEQLDLLAQTESLTAGMIHQIMERMSA